MPGKTIISTITLILTVQMSFGQEKHISIPTGKNGELTQWYTWQQEKIEKAGLSDLVLSEDSLHFRFSTETQAIDIWTADYTIFNGTVASFTTGYDEDNYKRKKPRPDKFYSQVNNLDTAIAREVYNLFTNLSVFKIPTDDSIQGWDQGYDGEQFIIEYATPSQYTFKEYWTPSAFKADIKEAATIDTLSTQIKNLIQLQRVFGEFIGSLPEGCYHSSSYYIICNNYTKKINRKSRSSEE